MKFLYLREENLKEKLFIQDLVHNFPADEPVLVLHAHFGEKPEDTRFVTKRIGALLSEQMVYNQAFSGDQRGLLTADGGRITVRADLVRELLQFASVLLLNPIGATPNGPEELDPLLVANVLQDAFSPAETILFPRNSKSPLAANKERVTGRADYERLLALYEEEAAVLEAAQRLAPVTLSGPVTFAK